MRRGALLSCLMLPCVLAAEEITITDADIASPNTVVFESENTYILDGIVYVDSGATLQIAAGTTVKAKPGAALVVARHGTISAVGTAEDPIVFTAESDDGSLTMEDDSLWGGIVILGNAPVIAVEGEGIPGLPEDGAKAGYGGDDAEDNSGVLEYVSIRHAGRAVEGDVAMAGLAFGGVGSGTTVDFVEVAATGFDGIEFHGGTVACKHLVSVFTGEKNYEFTEGWSGKGQFWFSLENFDTTDYDNVTALHNGVNIEEAGQTPALANVTFLGDGQKDGHIIRSHHGLFFRNNTGAKYYNSLFQDYTGKAFCVEDAQDPDSLDCRKRMEAGELFAKGCIFYLFGKNDEPDSNFVFMWDTLPGGDALPVFKTQQYAYNAMGTPQDSADYTQIQENFSSEWGSYTASASGGIFRIERDFSEETLNPAVHPLSEGYDPQYLPLAELSDEWFETVNYRGAFGADSNDVWIDGWTYLAQSGGRRATGVAGPAGAVAANGNVFEVPEVVRRGGNPVSIRIPLRTDRALEARIYDSRGRLCCRFARRGVTAETRVVELPLEGLGGGMYLCRLRSGLSNAAYPLVIP